MQSRLTPVLPDPAQDNARLPYVPALDGLRALAVVAVLLYHAGLNVWGGFLGVETFFVLSGYLITSLLQADWQRYGRIKLARFWMRRARRLLPALFLVLAGTLVFTSVRLPDEVADLRTDTLAALGYVMNWHLIVSQQSYFDASMRPPLLQHLWSLAVEEQFYLFWPLLFAAGRRYLRASALFFTTLAVAGLSVALMAILYQPGTDPSRVYYGTDTRASALLLGAALAMIWVPGRIPAAANRRVGLALDAVGLAALGGLIVAYARVYEVYPLLYRGGFVLIALTTAVVIAAVTHPSARVLPGLLGMRPLRWIGLRSYGIYLWYWPVFMVTRPYEDVPFGGGQVLLLRFGVVVSLAALSYRYIEMPIRRGAIGRWWQALGAARTRSLEKRAQAPGIAVNSTNGAERHSADQPDLAAPLTQINMLRFPIVEAAPPTERRRRAHAPARRRRHQRH